LEQPFDSVHGAGFRMIVFRNVLDGAEHIALVRGTIAPDSPTLVRMHRADMAADVLGEAGGRAQLVGQAIEALAREPEGGVLVVLRDPDPQALSNRLQSAQDSDHQRERMLREYGVGAQILRQLGVRRMTLLSNAPQKIVGLEGYGLEVAGWRGFTE
jgi:3,4-dihydroxy 2-butanone 4-phosphate synthase/GTP cyclohydrolase II